MEVISGLHQLRIPLPNNPLGHLNSYLLRGNEGCLLIDTGIDDDQSFRSLEEQLRNLGLAFSDLAMTLITHVHPDHYGLVGRISRSSPSSFAYHGLEKPLVESRYIRFAKLQEGLVLFLRSHGAPNSLAAPAQEGSMSQALGGAVWPDKVLLGGEVLLFGDFQLEVIWTPGHSPGHVCLYEHKNKLLFSGDHILPTITPNISFHPQSGSNPLGDYLSSLNKVVSLPVSLVLPAHERIFEDMQQRIRNIEIHHNARKKSILAILGEIPKTAYEIATTLPWSIPGQAFRLLDATNQRGAVMETIAHLELLRMEAQVERASLNGVEFYCQSSTMLCRSR